MDTSSSNLQLTFTATLKGHSGWVTAIATPSDPNMKFIVSSSRDKTAIVWHLTRDRESYGVPKRSLQGHNHFVQDITLSQDAQYALTSSWDKTMRLWDLSSGETVCNFVGHTGDVMSASFSPNNRLIVSGSRDKTIKVWNTRGECKGDLVAQTSTRGNSALAGHTEWVSAVRFSPDPENPQVVSAGWDKLVKVWDFKSEAPQLQVNHTGHSDYISTVAISPDGTLCASAGKDGIVMLWDLNKHCHLYSLEAGDIIHNLVFSPSRYWLCAATATSIKIWDLLSKTIIDDLRPEFPASKSSKPECVSLAWSADGATLFSGYSDNNIRVWEVTSRQ